MRNATRDGSGATRRVRAALGADPRARLTTGVTAAVAVAAALLLFLTLTASSAAAPADPPGNNGTVKIEGTPIDDIPNNEPHVGCTFTVEFRGYDQGDLRATLTFELQAPTLRDTGSQVLLEDTLAIGEDPAGGAGDLDAMQRYTLDFAGVTPHPQQGYHVKLTVHAEGSQGADVKHKVFWVTECAPPVTTTTTTSTTSTSTTSTSTTSTSTTSTSTTSTSTTSTSTSTTSTSTTSTTAAPTTTTTTAAPAPATTEVETQVLGVEISREEPQVSPVTELPRTGPNGLTRALLAVGAAFVMIGATVETALRLKRASS